MKCPNCGEEILEDSTVCPNCGESLTAKQELEQTPVDMTQQRTDLVLAAAILTIISAAFIASVGYIGIYQYQVLLDYYGSAMSSELLGFLIFGIVDVVCAALAVIGGTFMFRKAHLKTSILGVIFLLVSVLVTYVIIIQYQYGFTDILMFSEVTVFILSILSGTLIFSSKTEFTQT